MMQRHTLTRCLVFVVVIMFMATEDLHGWGMNNRYDPFPMYTTLEPQEFLYTREKELLKGHPEQKAAPQTMGISLSVFRQTACTARGSSCNNNNATTPTCGTTPLVCNIPLGDLDGRWNMIALLYNNPKGEYPPASCACGPNFTGCAPVQDVCNTTSSINPCLCAALCNLFPDGNGLNSPNNIDPDRKFGFFSNNLTYRKLGFRWEFEWQICGGLGFQFQSGVADICQTLTERVDLTRTSSATAGGCGPLEYCCLTSTISGSQVEQYLMSKLDCIANEINLDICSFHKTSIEDLFFNLYWRHGYEHNFDQDASWSRLLVIPFLRFGYGVGTGKSKDQDAIFSLPFGNNGHNSFNANGGINLDFGETIEIGAELAVSHFFARTIEGMRVPNSINQSGIYPYRTNVKVSPGDTWYFGAKLYAYHFIDMLSFYAQYILLHHEEDKLEFANCDCASYFDTKKCPNASFKVQLANFGFNYDISPNIAIGFLWQQPLSVQNAYYSSTMLFSFVATY